MTITIKLGATASRRLDWQSILYQGDIQTAGTGWQDGFWHSFPDGRPKPIHVTGSITNADIVVG